jgi:hypothetical protein
MRPSLRIRASDTYFGDFEWALIVSLLHGGFAKCVLTSQLFRLDGILGRVLASILCTGLIDAEPSLRGSEGKALK